MNKLISILIAFCAIICCSITASAHQKKYGNGQVTANYTGNKVEIVDNVKNVCIVVSVDKKKNNYGQTVYDVICGPNKFAHGLSKTALKKIIESNIESVAKDYGSIISPFAGYIAGELYDIVCGY